IEEPTVEHEIERGLGSLYGPCPEQAIPMLLDLCPSVLHILGVSIAMNEVDRLIAVVSLAEEKVYRCGLSGCNVEVHLQRGAGIKARTHGVGQAEALERRRASRIAVPSQKLSAVTGETMELHARGHEGGGFGELLVPGIVRQQRL